MLIAFSVPGFADFGDYAGDYDFGGNDSFDFDTGSNDSYDYGGSHDDYDYDDDDYNYGSGGNIFYYGGSGGSGGSGSSGFERTDDDGSFLGALLIVILIVVVILLISRKKKAASHTPIMPGAQRTDASTLKPVSEYLTLDPSFSEAEFTEKISNMYVKFQNSWQAKNMDDLRPYLTDAFFAQVDRQLDNYRNNNQTNRVERISVMGVDIAGWKQEKDCDVMVVNLRTRIVDYVVDDNSGSIVRGSNTAEKFMEYEWTLQRTSGQITAETMGTKVQNCPNCGATIDINHTAVCEYCGSVITTDTFDWAVSGIKGISQRTAGE